MKIQNLSQSFETMKILLDIRTHADAKTLLGISLITAIDNKQKPDEIIKFVQDQAQDNCRVMAAAIGWNLVQRILNL